jgi:hypothetical protein
MYPSMFTSLIINPNQMTTLHCKHCLSPIGAVIEYESGDWVILCFNCGVENILLLRLQSVGWKE